MAPDVARDYQRAADSEDVYVVVEGRLTFDPSGLPTTAFDDPLPPQPMTDIPARLTGRSMSEAGFVRPFEQDVTLRVSCFAVWCAEPRPGAVLAFLKREAGGYVVSVDPCGTMTYPDPRLEQLETVVACFQGRDCVPAAER